MANQTALITGASSGMGRGLAAWFAKRGLTVYAAARRTAELEKLRDDCQGASGKLIPLTLDVSDGEGTFARVAQLDQESGGLDLVIANAGVSGAESYGKRVDWPLLKRMIDVNVTGAVATLTGALPGMLKRSKGQLVGISSIAAFNGLPRMAGYCASKAYLTTFLEGLRHDVKPLGLVVCCIHPGYVKTELTAKRTKKMPFVLEADDAVERMGQAIERHEETLIFPWQLGLVAKGLAALPRPLFEAAAKLR